MRTFFAIYFPMFVFGVAATVLAQLGKKDLLGPISPAIVVSVFFVIAVPMLISSHATRRYFLVDFEGDQIPDQVIERLHHYAKMHGIKFAEEPSAGCYPLTPAQHKILLGITKKIEAKNAVLNAINIALLVLSFNVLVQWKGATVVTQTILVAAITIFTVLIIGRFDGIAHIAQRRSCRDLASKSPGTKMQVSLVRDMLQKEFVFAHAFWWMSVALVATSLLLLASWTLGV